MWLKENTYRVKLGGNYYINCPILIAFENESLFSIVRQEDGYLAIDFEVYNDAGLKIAAVRRNNIYLGNKDDYYLDGDEDSLRMLSRQSKKTLVQVNKRRAASPMELDVSVHTYLPDNRLLDLGPDSSNLGGMQMIGNTFENCQIGIGIARTGTGIGGTGIGLR